LLDRVRRRVGDKRILALVKAFLKAGILSEDGVTRETHTGTPQGGILSPLLANIALSILDDHFAEAWESFGNNQARSYRRSKGLPTYRVVRYAEDFVVLVAGTRTQAENLRNEVAAVLSPMGLRLSDEKTGICHIDEGFTFLGWRIQRQTMEGTKSKRFVYTWPSKKALASIRPRCVRSPGREPTTRSPISFASSTLCFGDGPTTSGTGYHRPPSATCTSSPGRGLSVGCGQSTVGPTGRSFEGATYPGGGQRTAR
jgi:RNA-directed DNA polymerase